VASLRYVVECLSTRALSLGTDGSWGFCGYGGMVFMVWVIFGADGDCYGGECTVVLGWWLGCSALRYAASGRFIVLVYGMV
jgi:hypothetical protein